MQLTPSGVRSGRFLGGKRWRSDLLMAYFNLCNFVVSIVAVGMSATHQRWPSVAS